MARFGMDVLIFVMNNSGLYRGDTDSADKYQEMRRNTLAGTTTEGTGLTAWSLGYETNYHNIAEMAGGIGLEACLNRQRFRRGTGTTFSRVTTALCRFHGLSLIRKSDPRTLGLC